MYRCSRNELLDSFCSRPNIPHVGIVFWQIFMVNVIAISIRIARVFGVCDECLFGVVWLMPWGPVWTLPRDSGVVTTSKLRVQHFPNPSDFIRVVT